MVQPVSSVGQSAPLNSTSTQGSMASAAVPVPPSLTPVTGSLIGTIAQVLSAPKQEKPDQEAIQFLGSESDFAKLQRLLEIPVNGTIQEQRNRCWKEVDRRLRLKDVAGLKACGYLLNGLRNAGKKSLFWCRLCDQDSETIHLFLKDLGSAIPVEERNESVHQAAELGNNSIINMLHTHGVGIDRPLGRENRTPLHVAILSGHRHVVDQLLTLDADQGLLTSFNLIRVDGQEVSCQVTAVALAVAAGQLGCIDPLIAPRLAADRYTAQIGSLLHVAVAFGQYSALQRLLGRHWGRIKAHLNDPGVRGLTPVALAVEYGRIEALDLFAERGADLWRKDGRGYTPLHRALIQGIAAEKKGDSSRWVAVLKRLAFRSPGHRIFNIRTPKGALPSAWAYRPQLKAAFSQAQQWANKREMVEVVRFFRREPPETVVFGGGGAKGPGHGGALRALQLSGALNWVKRMVGTSAGSMTALTEALGMPVDQSVELTVKTDFMQFLDHESPKRIIELQKSPGMINGLASYFKLWAMPKGFSVKGILNMISEFRKTHKRAGLCTGEPLLRFLGDIIEAETGERDFTFGQLADRVERGLPSPISGRRYKHLHVWALQISPEPELICFNSESKRFRNVPLRYAIRASTSIPLIYEPLRLKLKKRECQLVDAGMLVNEAVGQYHQQQFVFPWTRKNPKEAKAFVQNRRIVAFALHSAHVPQKDEKGLVGKFIDWITAPLSGAGPIEVLKGLGSVYWSWESLSRHPYDARQIIPVDCGSTPTLNFKLSAEQKSFLISAGQQAAQAVFRPNQYGFLSLQKARKSPVFSDEAALQEQTSLLEQGDRELRRGAYRIAEACFQRALVLDYQLHRKAKQNHELLSLLARARREQGDHEGACSAFQLAFLNQMRVAGEGEEGVWGLVRSLLPRAVDSSQIETLSESCAYLGSLGLHQLALDNYTELLKLIEQRTSRILRSEEFFTLVGELAQKVTFHADSLGRIKEAREFCAKAEEAVRVIPTPPAALARRIEETATLVKSVPRPDLQLLQIRSYLKENDGGAIGQILDSQDNHQIRRVLGLFEETGLLWLPARCYHKLALSWERVGRSIEALRNGQLAVQRSAVEKQKPDQQASYWETLARLHIKQHTDSQSELFSPRALHALPLHNRLAVVRCLCEAWSLRRVPPISKEGALDLGKLAHMKLVSAFDSLTFSGDPAIDSHLAALLAIVPTPSSAEALLRAQRWLKSAVEELYGGVAQPDKPAISKLYESKKSVVLDHFYRLDGYVRAIRMGLRQHRPVRRGSASSGFIDHKLDGDAAFSQRWWTSAFESYERALKQRQSAHGCDFLIAEALKRAGIAATHLQLSGKAEEYFKKAGALYKRLELNREVAEIGWRLQRLSKSASGEVKGKARL